MKLPEHYSLNISHNEHRSLYERLEDYIEQDHLEGCLDDKEKQECVENDSLWEIQWYPITPVSFYKVAASTLEKALEKIK